MIQIVLMLMLDIEELAELFLSHCETFLIMPAQEQLCFM